MRRIRIVLKVVTVVAGVLALGLLWLRVRDRDFERGTGATWGITVVGVSKGNLWVEWWPRTQYRPDWAGQVNRCGFRYNVYSDGSGYAWAPLWVLAALAGGTSVASGLLAWRTRGSCERGFPVDSTEITERVESSTTRPIRSAPVGRSATL